jgi:hypothetical protein
MLLYASTLVALAIASASDRSLVASRYYIGDVVAEQTLHEIAGSGSLADDYTELYDSLVNDGWVKPAARPCGSLSLACSWPMSAR